ncbi:MAG: acetylxylan esterase [Planctomycetes bacterium]|nr:acetylxylan esterase [Planctomycetota bacterium]
MRFVVATVVSFVVCVAAVAQEKLAADLQGLDARVFKPDSPEVKLRWDSLRTLRENVNKSDVAAWRTIKTKADWEKYRIAHLAKLRASLGKFPETPKQVKVVTTKKLQGEGFTVECILYESRPNFFVTANLYVPEKTDKPMPGFIVIHSHHNPKTQGELQDMGMNWARQGCLVLVPDMIDHGERRQHPFKDAKSYPGPFKTGRQDYFFRYNVNLQLSLVGESLMGWMVWDLMRGVDVLLQRPNIDRQKIMVFGSVAGGGDPCAVFAALDERVAAAAPFNFGGPQPETKFPLPKDAELAFNYMGGGSWESTRNLKLSARDGFLPWLIVGSIAPRGLIYGHEFAWDEKRDPVWTRFNTIWGDFYGAKGKLASAKGSGSVRGQAPESTHCNNIGAVHRKPIYPTLKQWFGLPIIEMEYKKRFDSSELQCWTDDWKQKLKPKMVHELARELANQNSVPTSVKDALIARLGVTLPVGVKAVLERVPAEKPLPNKTGFRAERMIVRPPDEPGHAVPLVILRPANKVKHTSIVIGIAQSGKAGFLKHRAETIAELLKRNIAVCLPDLRGTGETANDGRGRTSGATSYSASLLMHGQTVPGVQLQELVLVMNALPRLGFKSIALWGDSFAPTNDPKINFAVPYDVAKFPAQAEPMGGTLALLGGAFGGGNVKAIYIRGGMVSFRSMLDSPFCYFPHDAVIPGVLPGGDIDSLAKVQANRGLRMEGLVDGLNRRVEQKSLDAAFRGVVFTRPAHKMLVLRAEPGSPADVATWLANQVKK